LQKQKALSDSLTEFDLIQHFFMRSKKRASTRLSIGDDCALLAVPDGYELAVTTDTMVENVHFFSDVNPEALGYKLLAVNLSDLASMGAEPIAVTLALTMPKVDVAWLEAFAKGFFSLADQFEIDLIGGDTTSGTLTLSVQAMGVVPKQGALYRSSAQVGDLIFVTGTLGDAGLGLKIKQGFVNQYGELALCRFNRPEPRVNEGLALRSVANACIDISDGLLADLGHILEKSSVGACVDYENLPLSEPVQDYIKTTHDWCMPLNAGDDYELCFTMAKDRVNELNISATCIGVIEEKQGVRLMRKGKIEKYVVSGFEHFNGVS